MSRRWGDGPSEEELDNARQPEARVEYVKVIEWWHREYIRTWW